MILDYNRFILEKKGPCWAGYKQIGTKDKDGRPVPNCVKENSDVNEEKETIQKFSENGATKIKIYHGTLSEDDAKSILKNGWDESRRYGASAEGSGMGAFFSSEGMIYGKWTVEFEVPVNDFRNFIVFDTSLNPYSVNKEYPTEVIDLAKSINGRAESVEEQVLRINGNDSLVPNVHRWYDKDIGRIKGWVTRWRFDRASIHLRDTSIAKPVRYFKK